jgi:hypothetical protein
MPAAEGAPLEYGFLPVAPVAPAAAAMLPRRAREESIHAHRDAFGRGMTNRHHATS